MQKVILFHVLLSTITFLLLKALIEWKWIEEGTRPPMEANCLLHITLKPYWPRYLEEKMKLFQTDRVQIILPLHSLWFMNEIWCFHFNMIHIFSWKKCKTTWKGIEEIIFSGMFIIELWKSLIRSYKLLNCNCIQFDIILDVLLAVKQIKQW